MTERDEDATPQAPKKKRPRRARRVAAWVGSALLVLPILVMGTVLVLVSTNPGLEVVRGVAVSITNDILTGELRVGRISGSLLSELVIEDASLDDATGREAAAFERLALTWDAAALLEGRIDVERVDLEGPKVRLVQTATGGLNLANLVPPSDEPPPPASDAPLNLPRIEVAALRVERGDIDFVADGERLADARGLALSLTATASGDRVVAALDRLSARVQEGLPLRARARAELEGARLLVDDLRLELADGRVRVPRLETALPPGPLAGRARLEVPAALVRRLGGPRELLADIDVEAAASRAAEAPRWSARLDGQVGPGPLTLAATVTESLNEVRADLDLRRLDPSRVWAGLPEARLKVGVETDGSVTAPDLKARVAVRGWLRPRPGGDRIAARPLELTARWRGDTAEVSALGRVAGARLDVDARLAALADLAPRVERGRVDVDVPDLTPLAALAGTAGRGRLSLTATVSGPVTALSAAGALDVDRLAVGDAVRVRSLTGRWDLSGIPDALDGRARLDVGPVRLPDRALEGAQLRVHAESSRGRTQVDLERFAVRAGGVTFRGGGARLVRAPSGALALTGFGLRSTAGRIFAEGRLSPGGLARGPLSAELRLEALDLEKVPRRLVPELEEIAGRIDGKITAARARGRTRGEVAVDASGVRLAEGRPHVAGSVDAELRPGRLAAEVSLQGLARALRLDADVPAPRDATRARGWTRALRAGPVRSLDLEVEALDLAAVQRFVGTEAEVEGFVNLRADVRDGGREVRLDLDTRDLALGPPLEKAEAGLETHLRFATGRARASGRIEGEPLGSGTFTATVAGPPSLFDAEEWSRLTPASLEGARVDFDDLRVEALEELGLLEGAAGRVDVKLEAERGAKPLNASVDAQGVVLPWLEGEWGTELRGRLTATEARTTVKLRVDQRDILDGRASAPISLDELLEASPKALAELPIDARLDIEGLPVARVAKAAGLLPSRVGGELFLHLDAKGPPSSLAGQLALDARNLVLFERGYTLTASADFEGRSLTSSAAFAARDAGGIRLDASGELLEDGVRADAKLTGDGLPVDFVSQLGLTPLGLGGALHADARVQVSPDGPRPEGWLEVRDLRVVYPQPALQPLYGGKLRLNLAPDAARLAVDAKSMGGSVRARAEAKGIEDPENLDLTANARLKDFPVKAGQLARVDLEADVEGTIRREEGTRVDVRLHDGFVTLPDETTRDLHPITSPGEVTYVSELEVTRPEEDEEKEPEGPPVIIHIDVEDPISIRGDPVTARLDLDLESRTNVEKNAGLQGEIWVTDGTVDLVGREYKIEKAEIILEGRQPPNPRIDVRLVHFFSASGVEFMVRVSGNANEPRVDFASSPARFSETELLSIFTGTDPSDIGQVDDRPPEEQAAGAAVGFITGQIQQQLGQVLPLDTLEVGASETGVSNVTLGKWITREVFLAYRQEFRAQENQNPFEAVLEYRFLPGWLAELVVGPLAQDLDVLWTTRW